VDKIQENGHSGDNIEWFYENYSVIILSDRGTETISNFSTSYL